MSLSDDQRLNTLAVPYLRIMQRTLDARHMLQRGTICS